jgi:hypothetical protein
MYLTPKISKVQLLHTTKIRLPYTQKRAVDNTKIKGHTTLKSKRRALNFERKNTIDTLFITLNIYLKSLRKQIVTKFTIFHNSLKYKDLYL